MKLGKGFEMEFLTFFGSTLDFFKDVSIKYPQFPWILIGMILILAGQLATIFTSVRLKISI